MNTKKLISKYLAALWLVSLLGFLGLQIGTEITQGNQKSKNNPEAKEFVILATHQGQASDFAPDHKLLPAFLLPQSDVFCVRDKTGLLSGFVFHPLLNVNLILALRSSISIHAP